MKFNTNVLPGALANRRNMILRDMGLPMNLIELIRDGQLNAAVDDAFERYEKRLHAFDAWEAANPEMAAAAPWSEAREAWKAVGRPEPAWYELLAAETMDAPITGKMISHDLYNTLAVANGKRKTKEKQRLRALAKASEEAKVKETQQVQQARPVRPRKAHKPAG